MKKMNWLGLILALVMCLALVPAQAETMEVMESESYSVSSPYSNDELFAAYVQGEMDKTVYGDAAMFGTLGRSKLTTEASCKLYDAVKAMIVDIAAGERSSTAYSIDLEALGFKTEYTNADIGVDAIFEVNGENWTVLPDAKTKLDAIRSEMLEEMGLSNGKLVNALLQDCPYELYWFKKNKPIGDEYGGFAYANGAGYSIYGSTHTYTFKNFNLSFAVAKEFGYGYAVDTSTTGAAAAAISNAQAIVDRYEHLSDEDKLLAYKNEICNLTSYNDAAADDSTNTPYGNPWQLIWVFDGNSSTTVVCEGYSKAFAYLCDLSEFDSKIFCYTVSGEMNGGAHMWNIVQTPDGNYLVDVTNCDSDMIGNPNNLYMVSDANGTWNTTYRIAIEGQATVSYTYDSDTISMWGEEVLKLGEKHTHSWKPVSYTWSGTYGACSATRKCDCGESETVFAVVQQTVKQEGSCKDVGINTYTATFSADWASTQTKDVETGIAITNHVGGSEQRNQKPATCSENGYTGDVYCLGCGGLIGKGLTTPATGEHSYTASAYTWNADQTECVATGVCGACGAETSANAEVTEEQILAPTCGKDGEKKITARFDESWAEEQSVTVAIPATGAHVYGEVSYDWADDLSACTASHACGCEYTETAEAKVTSEITTAATCVAKGEKTYTATFDKEWATTQTKTEAIEKDAANHTGETELRGKVDATCGADGYTGDTYCLGCGNKLEDGEALPATGEHNYADEVPDTRVPATCMATGSVTMQCTGCNATEEQTLPIDPDKHTGNTTTKNASEATCGEAGYTGDTVCECGKKLETGEPIPATGDHKYTVEVEGSREAATCKDAGSVTMQCENCDATEEQTLPVDPTNHTGDTEVRNAKAPDCANDGYTGDTYCLGCNAKIKDGETISATGEHNFASEVAGTRVDATCMTKGSVTMQCTGCDATEEQTLPIDRFNHTGNTTTENAAEPTCGAEGYTGDTYCECGMVIKMGQPIPATEEHDFTEIVEGSEVTPTCKTEGSLTLKCANCEATSVDKLGYDPANHEGGTELRNAKAPDCANAGYTGDTHCLGCGEKLKDGEPIPANGEHSYTIEVEGTRIPSTCKTPGKVTMQCSGCTDTEEQTLPVDPANHEGETEVRGAKEATCTEDGYTGDLYCLDCETVIEEGEAIPAGHEDEDGDGICDNCPAVLAYRIDIAPSEGGSASASSEKAAAGEEVIITLTPEDGMEMEYLVVVLADGRTITPRLVSENRYTFIQPEGDVTVHAFFKALPVDPKVTVTFHANGGVGVMMPVQVTSGQPYTLPECAFLPAEGYAFKGWALTADGPVLPQSVTVGGSIDLYAIWQLEGASVPVPPATGDNANINLWLVMMALSAACIVYLLTGRKRKV